MKRLVASSTCGRVYQALPLLVLLISNTSHSTSIGTFVDQPPLSQGRLESPQSLVTVDLDSDGDQDIVTASSLNPEIIWYENLGNNQFSEHSIATLAATTDALTIVMVAAADFDGDGHVDIVASDWLARKILRYTNNGQQQFSGQLLSDSTARVQAMLAVDFDADGDVDLVAGGRFGLTSDPALSWYENDSAGGFVVHAIDSSDRSVNSVFVEDIDQDGNLDVLASFGSAAKLSWYRNSGSQQFTVAELETASDFAAAAVASDIDGDGDIDLVSGDFQSLQLHRNIGSEQFALEQITTDPKVGNIQFITLADSDNDGDRDLLVAASRGREPGTIDVYENRHLNSGQFNRRSIANLSIDPLAIAVADLNGDGKVDAVSAARISDHVVTHINQGDNKFSVQVLTEPSPANSPRSVSVADIDGDHDLDVVSASADDNRVNWYRNDGLGAFQATVVSDQAMSARSAVAADVDGDGAVDLLSASSADNKIAWYQNDGSEQFTERPISSSAVRAAKVLAVDLDSDGDLDAVSAGGFTRNELAWYENDGSEQFATHTLINDPPITSGGARLPEPIIASGDLNGDSQVDLVAAFGFDLAWYKNNGDRSFKQRTIATPNYITRGLFVVDLDGDGDLDIVAGGQPQLQTPPLSPAFSEPVMWYENDGNGDITPHSIDSSFDGVSSVHADDVDADGDIDIIATHVFDSAMVWYENDGAQQFRQQLIPSQVIFEPWSAVTADFNGDGAVDVVAASAGSNTVSWHQSSFGNLIFCDDFE